MPSGPHGLGQSQVVSQIGGPYNRRPGGRGPGGWWILTEVEVELEAHEVYRPDVVGFRGHLTVGKPHRRDPVEQTDLFAAPVLLVRSDP